MKPRLFPCISVAWQLGLVEREITALLKGITAQQQNNNVRARRLAKQAQVIGEGIRCLKLRFGEKKGIGHLH